MTLSEKLQKLNEIKQESLSAIREKGVALPDDAPFEDYPDAIRSISQTTSGGIGEFSNVYSYNETIVGIWENKDGTRQLLYRKCGDITMPVENSGANFHIGLPRGCYVRREEYFVDDGDSNGVMYKRRIPHYSSKGYAYISTYRGGLNAEPYVAINATLYPGMHGIAIVEYTKNDEFIT